nr:zinc-ribbon domain-containing protein [Streptomyces albus]
MLNLLCGFCGNPAAHPLRKRVTKFSLFFIPLFPIAPARYSIQCTFCGAQTEVPKDAAEQMLAQGGAPGPQQGMGGPQQTGAPSGNPFAARNPYAHNPATQQPQQPQQPRNPYQS